MTDPSEGAAAQGESCIPGKDASLESTMLSGYRFGCGLGATRIDELKTLGPDMQSSAMHRTLLARYDKSIADAKA